MTSFLCAIGTANPPHRIPRGQIADLMASDLQLDAAGRRKLQALYRVAGIAQRYTMLPGFGWANETFKFFLNTPDLEPFPTVGRRLALDIELVQALGLNRSVQRTRINFSLG